MLPTRDEQARALGRFRDRKFAELITWTLQLAVEHYPEEVRSALAQVFDLKAVEEANRRVMSTLAETQRLAGQVRDMLRQLQRDLERLQADQSV